jgi:hypothetical protein
MYCNPRFSKMSARAKRKRLLSQPSVHEASHALIATLGGTGVSEASVDPYGTMTKYVVLKRPTDVGDLPAIVGGVAGERVLFGSDVRDCGGDIDNPVSDRAVVAKMLGRRRGQFDEFANQTQAILKAPEVVEQVEDLAKLLEKRVTLPGYQLDEFLDRRPHFRDKFGYAVKNLSGGMADYLKATHPVYSKKCVSHFGDYRGQCSICGNEVAFHDRPAVCVGPSWTADDFSHYRQEHLKPLCDPCARRHSPGLFQNVLLNTKGILVR